jgi:hypothetical protein
LATLILAAVCATAALLLPYLLGPPAPMWAGTSLAFAGLIAAFVAVWRSRPGPRAVAAAVLILVNMVLALRAILTPR